MNLDLAPLEIKKIGPCYLTCPFSMTRSFVTALLAIALLAMAVPALAGQIVYNLSAGDAVTFDILDDTDPPITLTIDDSGHAQFPIIGAVEIAGHSLPDAIIAVRKEYQDRQIYLDPKFSLFVSTFRPIFVLGQVRNPGSFPFSFGLTVEKAVGLAGGPPILTNDVASAIIAQAKLQGDVEAAEGEIVHEAVYAARLVAELNGRDEIDLADAPEAAGKILKDAPVEAVVEIEKRILKTEQTNFNNQVTILTQGVAEAKKGLQLLDDLAQQQEVVLKTISKDLERISTLRKSGLNTENEVSQGERNESSEKARLIEIYGEMSRSRREFGSLELDLAKLKADRERDLLKQLQDRQFAIEKLLKDRSSAQQQLYLMASVVIDAKKQTLSRTYAYELRRTSNGTTSTVPATGLTELEPGDVIVTSIATM
jgi:polysaccharide biosynthesis/export protein ExoF